MRSQSSVGVALMVILSSVLFVPPLCFGSAVKDTPNSAETFAEVAKLFQRGEGRVDLDKFQSMLVDCADRHADHLPYDKQDDKFYNSIDALFAYVDAHRLEAADIEAIREWESASFVCGDAPEPDFGESTGAEISWALRRVWECVQNNWGEYEPRHAVLGSALSVVPLSLSKLADCVKRTRDPARVTKLLADSRLGLIEQFLLDKENRSLRQAILKDATALDRACNMDESFECDREIQGLLDDRRDREAFATHLAAVVSLSEKSIKALPSFGLTERYNEARRLRAVWNIVQSLGDESSKNVFREYLVALREVYEARADAVTVKWLDEVTARPGKPVEKYLHEVVLRPIAPRGGGTEQK